MSIVSQIVERMELHGVLDVLMDAGVIQYSVVFNWKDGTYTVSWPNPKKQVNQSDEE